MKDRQVNSKRIRAAACCWMLALAASSLRAADAVSAPAAETPAHEALLAQFKKLGYEPLGGSPDDFRRYIDAELRKWTSAAQIAGVKK